MIYELLMHFQPLKSNSFPHNVFFLPGLMDDLQFMFFSTELQLYHEVGG